MGSFLETKWESLLLADSKTLCGRVWLVGDSKTSYFMGPAYTVEGGLDWRWRHRGLKKTKQIQRNIGRSSWQHCNLRKLASPGTPMFETVKVRKSGIVGPGTKNDFR